MARKKKSQGDEMKMNMTPMIDVVFQLIIFFMLVTEMAQADLEMLTLPSASEASPDNNPEKKRITVNLLPPEAGGVCRVKVKGKVMDQKALHRYLKTEAEISRDPDDPRLSTRALLIRADRETTFRWVQFVMQECVKPGVGIWKIQIAVKEPDAKK
ncbi:MAG: ExbD/TolR family protein [Planctomycetota bacterium]|jgi:biopolymer transport protein ExbD